MTAARQMGAAPNDRDSRARADFFRRHGRAEKRDGWRAGRDRQMHRAAVVRDHGGASAVKREQID